MSNNNYINHLLESLDLNNDSTTDFIPLPYSCTTSCFRSSKDRYDDNTKFLRLKAKKDVHTCPFCRATLNNLDELKYRI